jgi:hypothetical protein
MKIASFDTRDKSISIYSRYILLAKELGITSYKLSRLLKNNKFIYINHLFITNDIKLIRK